jgi:hypothetical protein
MFHRTKRLSRERLIEDAERKRGRFSREGAKVAKEDYLVPGALRATDRKLKTSEGRGAQPLGCSLTRPRVEPRAPKDAE